MDDNRWTKYNFEWRNVCVIEVDWETRIIAWRFKNELPTKRRENDTSGYIIDANWDQMHLKMAIDRLISEEFVCIYELENMTDEKINIIKYIQDMFEHPYEMPDYLYRKPCKELMAIHDAI